MSVQHATWVTSVVVDCGIVVNILICAMTKGDDIASENAHLNGFVDRRITTAVILMCVGMVLCR